MNKNLSHHKINDDRTSVQGGSSKWKSCTRSLLLVRLASLQDEHTQPLVYMPAPAMFRR